MLAAYFVSGFGRARLTWLSSWAFISAIGIGYHRLLTHRGFKCNTWLRRILGWLGAAALQGGPARWARIHRRHHQATDKHGDPHTPLMGFLHAHMGWIMRRDAEEGSDYRELVPDISGHDPW